MAQSHVGSVLDESNLTAASKKGGRICQICDVGIKRHLKRHVIGTHLPWYTDPTEACWECGCYAANMPRHLDCSERVHSPNPGFSDMQLSLWYRLMFGVLLFFTNTFGVDSVPQLLGYVVVNELFPPQQATLSYSHTQFFLGLCHSFNLGDIPSSFSISPPNHVVCILHWTILSRLVSILKSEPVWKLWDEFKSLCVPIPFPSNAVPFNETCVDSHCHLDKILSSYNFRSVSAIRHHFSAGACGFDLQFVVCNFVFPNLWWTKDYLLGVSSLVYGTIGVHPHFVDPDDVEGQLQSVADFLDGGNFIGVGEVGLDFTEKCPCCPKCLKKEQCPARNRKIEAQRLFLQGVLPLASQHKLPLVLHCREQESGAASEKSAAEEVREMIVSKGLAHLKIHRHCFIGCVEEMRRWQSSFPNVMFGFTSKSLTNPDTCAALAHLGLDQILAETDSPYFWKSGISSPWEIHKVIKDISEIKNIPMSVLTKVLTKNTREMYCV